MELWSRGGQGCISSWQLNLVTIYKNISGSSIFGSIRAESLKESWKQAKAWHYARWLVRMQCYLWQKPWDLRAHGKKVEAWHHLSGWSPLRELRRGCWWKCNLSYSGNPRMLEVPGLCSQGQWQVWNVAADLSCDTGGLCCGWQSWGSRASQALWSPGSCE